MQSSKKICAKNFPKRQIKRDDSALRETVEKILNHLDNNEPHLDLPLDISVDRVSTSGLGEAARDSVRSNSFVRRRGESR